MIASEQWLKLIANQHRNVSGIDMEMFGHYRAAEYKSRDPAFFAAKVVVDYGDYAKDDSLHEDGCHVSARFTISAIERLLPSGSYDC